MDSIDSTSSVNSLSISTGVHRSQRTAFNAASTAERNSDGSARRSRWENTPGIRVSLQSLEQQPEVNDYQQLRSDGRRKESTMEAAPIDHTERIIEAEQTDKENSRSVNPRSRVILDSFIQQMGGAEQSVSSGNYINTTI